MALTIGETLQGRYRIDGLLGQGGMGAVYRAWDNRLGITVALKEMTPQPGLDPRLLVQLRKQFRQEANVLARLDHPHLVRVIDFFEGESNGYLVMDFVEGESLVERIGREGALEEKQVLRWAEELLDALEYCHDQGVLHRDVKPHNVIIRADGRAVLVDFGLVKLWDPDDPHTKTAMRGMGTPEYAPPEQYDVTAGHTDPRSDVYSVGATLYHALTGETPPSATQRMVNPASLKSPSVLNADLTAETERAVLMALEPQPEHRFQSAGEMAAVLSGEKPFPARSTSAQMGPTGTTMLPGAAAPARGRGRLLWAGLGLAVLAALGWWLTRPRSPLGVALVTPTLVADVTATAVPTLLPPTGAHTQMLTPSPTPEPTPIRMIWQRVYSGSAFPRSQVNTVVVDPRDPDVLYAATVIGIYKSLNGGVSWQPSHSGLGHAEAVRLVVDPDDTQTLYATTGGGSVYKTSDGGLTWQEASDGIDVTYAFWGGRIVVLDPQDSQHLYFSHGIGVYESRDGGESWEFRGGPQGVFDLVVDPRDGDCVYAAGWGEGLERGFYRYRCGVAGWEHILGIEEEDEYGQALAITSRDAPTLYASDSLDENGRIYRSQDGGDNWTVVMQGTRCRFLAVDPHDEQVLYCGGNDGAFVSRDGGRSWGAWGLNYMLVNSIVLSPDGQRIYAGGEGGVYVSANGGAIWDSLSSGLGNQRVEIHVDPSDGAMAYAYADWPTWNLYRSSDGGANWQELTTAPDGRGDLAIDPVSGALYRAHNNYGDVFYRSLDGGLTWTTLVLPQTGINTIAAHPQNGGQLYALYRSENPYLSTDGGLTWEREVAEGPGGDELYFDEQGEVMYLICDTGGGAARSTDGGYHWDSCADIPSNDWFAQVAVDPTDSQRLYAATRGGGVYVSEDGCRSWQPRKQGLGNLYVNAIVINPTDPNLVYAGTDGGAYVSYDSGGHWGVVNDGLLGATVIYDIAIDSNDPDAIHAATPYGVFRLEDR